MQGKDNSWKTLIGRVLEILVLTVSLALIVIISIDAFAPETRLSGHDFYRLVQLPFCLLFMADFFFELYRSTDRSRFFRHNFLILFVSIPYSIILGTFGIAPDGFGGIFLHYLPTLRAVLAMAYVTSFISRDRLIGLFASYAMILLLSIYFASLIFFLAERHVNPAVTDYWTALYWSILQATTLGASFYAVTTVGKAVAMVISVMGMLMFPLFTVYLTRIVKKYAAYDTPQSDKKS